MKWLWGILFLIVISSLGYGLVFAAVLNTSVVAITPTITLTQSDYRWYQNIDTLTPTVGLGVENAVTSTPNAGTTIRLRINILDTLLDLGSGATFTLQYSLSTSSGWADIATSTSWIFSDNPSVADGQVIASTVLSDSDVGETYNESNPTAATPNAVTVGNKGEWDWAIKNNSAATSSDWFFRMIYSSSTPLDFYTNYPALTAVSVQPPAPPPTPPSGGGSFGVPATPPTAPPLHQPFPYPGEKPPVPSQIVDLLDLNGDRRIDMADFSILLFYWGRQGNAIRRYDFNHDSVVDLADVSILLYYWTV